MGLTSYPHIVWCVSWNLPKFLLFLVFLHVCMLVIARPQYSFVYVLACYLAMVAFAFCSLVASLANHQRTFCTLSKTKFGELATPFDTLCHPFSFSQSVLVPWDNTPATIRTLTWLPVWSYTAASFPRGSGKSKSFRAAISRKCSAVQVEICCLADGVNPVKVDRFSEVSLSYDPNSA